MRDGRWTGSGREIARHTSATPAGFRPRFPGTRHRSGPLSLLLATVLGCLLAGPPALLPTARADSDSQVSIELTALTPAISDPDAKLTFEGRVTNTSDRPLERLQAMIWRNLTPYTTRDQLTQTNASPPTEPVGARMYSPATPTAYQNLYSDDTVELAPGDSQTFRVTAKASDFFESANPAPGVYLAGVQVRENATTTVGRVRSYVVAAGDDDDLQSGQQAIGTSTIVELAATPTMARSGVFANDELSDQIRDGGRLDRLLTAAERTDTSFAVDPNLLLELKSMKAGYRVVDSDGKQSEGKGKQAAADWLTRFAALRRSHDGFQLLYGRPDLVSLVHAGRLSIVRGGQQVAGKIAESSGLPLLVAPADGAADRATLHAAKKLGAAAVLLDQADLDPSGKRRLGPVVQATDSPRILAYTNDATTGPGPDPRDTEVQQRQASLAGSYVDSISGQPPAALGRLRLVSDADQADSANATLQAPWLKARPVKDLLDDETTSLGDGPEYPQTARQAEFKPGQLRRLQRLQDNLQTYADLLDQHSGAQTLVNQSPPRAASISWRGRRAAQSQYIRAQQQLLTAGQPAEPISLEELTKSDVIRVESNPQVTLTGSGSYVPVTVVNELNSPITVQLRANSANQSRLRLEDVPAKDIGKAGVVQPGARVPVQIPARADANGDMPVTLQLATKQGQDVGKPLTIRVNATQAGLVGWVIAIAAGIVLLGTVVLRIRQVARERGDADTVLEAAGPADMPDEADEASQSTVIRPRHSTDAGNPDPGNPDSENPNSENPADPGGADPASTTDGVRG